MYKIVEFLMKNLQNGKYREKKWAMGNTKIQPSRI